MGKPAMEFVGREDGTGEGGGGLYEEAGNRGHLKGNGEIKTKVLLNRSMLGKRPEFDAVEAAPGEGVDGRGIDSNHRDFDFDAFA